MDVNKLLLRFDGRSRLLIRSLLSGSLSVQRALSVFSRQRRSDPDFSLRYCFETLCQAELSHNCDAQTNLTVKPLVCLFPVAFKRSLLTFLHHIHHVLPQAAMVQLIDCLSQEASQNPWICALIAQLRRDIRTHGQVPLFTPQCRERLRGLCRRLEGAGGSWRWGSMLSEPVEDPSSQNRTLVSNSSQQNKRKISDGVDLDAGVDGQLRKRMKTDLSSPEEDLVNPQPALELEGFSVVVPQSGEESSAKCHSGEGQSVLESEGSGIAVSRSDGNPPKSDIVELEQSLAPGLCSVLPEDIKASVSQIKELLDGEMEWDQNAVEILKVLNQCDPTQVELLCATLCLSEVPEKTLPHLWSCLLAVSPDLSYSTVVTLIRSLLLGKVLSLTEPASRCLVSTAASVCSRYPRPVCDALMRPLLEEGNTGSAQAELLCRLVEDCLDPHYKHLVFQMSLRGPWNDDVLSLLHVLLDSKLEMDEELFSLFIDKLSSQAPLFTQSMKFAKIMLTVLTKYNTRLRESHQQTLACCLSSNETFLKKSLHAALKRITRS